MGRKTQITKEAMLQAAFEILEQDGYTAVNIKAIAAKVGCSTQPISWQFGNMQGLRSELFTYAGNIIWGHIHPDIEGMNAIAAFFESGKAYIAAACEHPKVFRFLCVDDPGDLIEKKSNYMDMLGDKYVKEMLALEIKLSNEEINKLVSEIVIYTHGLATMMLWNSFKLEKEDAFKLVYEHAERVFKDYGINASEYVSL